MMQKDQRENRQKKDTRDRTKTFKMSYFSEYEKVKNFLIFFYHSQVHFSDEKSLSDSQTPSHYCFPAL